jgi:type II secretory pathway component GspD/PulD (secretin)
LQVQLTVSRYQGEKKTGSLPYTLQVVAIRNSSVLALENPSSSLRMGVDVPVRVSTIAKEGVKEGDEPFSYRNVGTNIDCRASTLEDDRYRLIVSVEQSSIVPPGEPGQTATVKAGVPLFRTFKSSINVILRNGQSMQYVAATDPVSGESVRIDVTLAVLK